MSTAPNTHSTRIFGVAVEAADRNAPLKLVYVIGADVEDLDTALDDARLALDEVSSVPNTLSAP